MGSYPGLSSWALNALTGVLVSERRGRLQTHTGGDVRMEAETEAMWPQARDCQQLPDAGRGRKRMFL